MQDPAHCTTMAQLRAQIDQLDAALVAMLAQRAGYIDRAARIKAGADLPARIPERIEEVVAHVRAKAEHQGLSPDLVETLWRQLIDWSIAREEVTLGQGTFKKENEHGSGAD